MKSFDQIYNEHLEEKLGFLGKSLLGAGAGAFIGNKLGSNNPGRDAMIGSSLVHAPDMIRGGIKAGRAVKNFIPKVGNFASKVGNVAGNVASGTKNIIANPKVFGKQFTAGLKNAGKFNKLLKGGKVVKGLGAGAKLGAKIGGGLGIGAAAIGGHALGNAATQAAINRFGIDARHQKILADQQKVMPQPGDKRANLQAKVEQWRQLQRRQPVPWSLQHALETVRECEKLYFKGIKLQDSLQLREAAWFIPHLVAGGAGLATGIWRGARKAGAAGRELRQQRGQGVEIQDNPETVAQAKPWDFVNKNGQRIVLTQLDIDYAKRIRNETAATGNQVENNNRGISNAQPGDWVISRSGLKTALTIEHINSARRALGLPPSTGQSSQPVTTPQQQQSQRATQASAGALQSDRPPPTNHPQYDADLAARSTAKGSTNINDVNMSTQVTHSTVDRWGNPLPSWQVWNNALINWAQEEQAKGTDPARINAEIRKRIDVQNEVNRQAGISTRRDVSNFLIPETPAPQKPEEEFCK